MEESSPDDLAALALSERELFSLYVQYPEIDFDPQSSEEMPESTEHFSSPASHTAERDDVDSVQMSNSTRHTTPLKHDLFISSSSSDDEYTVFRSQLRQCDLPSSTVGYLKSLGARIVQLGRCLVADEGMKNGAITEMANSLLPQLQHSDRRISEQIDTISYITDLAPFSITPTDVSLWSNYRQRASLITQHLSLPSQTELDLLDQLLHVFDAYVYNPHLHLRFQTTTINLETSASIEALYNAIMTLLASYQRWHHALRTFKAQLMNPLMRRIQDSPWIQREIEQAEITLEAANAALKSDGACGPAPGLSLGEEQIKAVTKVVERRAKNSTSKNMVPPKVRTRFKKEQTILKNPKTAGRC